LANRSVAPVGQIKPSMTQNWRVARLLEMLWGM